MVLISRIFLLQFNIKLLFDFELLTTGKGLFYFSSKFALKYGMRIKLDDVLYKRNIYDKKYDESNGKKLEIIWNIIKFYLIILLSKMLN